MTDKDTFNMNGLTDTNYRYKCPVPMTKIMGQGNGIYTQFLNINKICKIINHPHNIVMKYIAISTGSNYIEEKETITGTHTQDSIKKLLLLYIKNLIICPSCMIPETVPIIDKKELKLTCFSCKKISNINDSNKNISKAINMIKRYLETGYVFKQTKGTCVAQTTSVSTEKEGAINPFTNNDSDIDIDDI
jgi:translation initiation factor 2 beta subunit (eIF-2beta)/eIF-5